MAKDTADNEQYTVVEVNTDNNYHSGWQRSGCFVSYLL